MTKMATVVPSRAKRHDNRFSKNRSVESMENTLGALIKSYWPAMLGVAALVIFTGALMFALGRESVQPQLQQPQQQDIPRPTALPDPILAHEFTCSDWVEGHAENLGTNGQVASINGFAQEALDLHHYVTAYLAWKYPQIANSTDAYSFEYKLSNYCAGHPGDQLGGAIDALASGSP